MSNHPIPPTVEAGRLREVCERYLRAPSNVAGDPDTGALTFQFEPDLSAGEADTFATLLRIAAAHVTGLSPAEFTALLPDLSGLRQYHDLASPTNAQSVAAVKALIRVCRAILRD